MSEVAIHKFQPEDSEYLRALCGYLYCIGSKEDVWLLKKAKYEINMDMGCMIDGEWIESLQKDIAQEENLRERREIILNFIAYYKGYEVSDNDNVHNINLNIHYMALDEVWEKVDLLKFLYRQSNAKIF